MRRALTKISLPDGVRKLDSNAFSRLPALTEIRLPNGLTTLGAFAFYVCRKFRKIRLPAELRHIGDRAFSGRSPDLTFDVAAGSYAEECARENGIRFETR